ncbi:hypothetical protein B0H34DRAFT_498297 [Crassisporium funariophilum]|nr:hypothetical protein B0H34DRAFT_498297 [Crassisporium funariophilum]
MAIFREAHDFIITGGEFTDQSKTGMNGIQWLHQAIAASAIHDSDERYDPPKCHPETRKVIIDDIMKWIQDRERSMKALWVHGPAGAGKSAIAQTIAELCQEYGLLAASFFFSRTSRDRNSAKRFFSTLAYQLAIAIPKLKERIEKVIEVDPSVVNKSMDIQLKKLILQPLSRIQLSSTQGLPRVIVIDGLDECVEEKHQTDILQFIRMALKEDNFPFCIIITSRPEYHILGEFDSPAYRKIAWRLELNNRIDTREDIRIVLRAGFAKVHDNPTHRYTMASISKPWLTNYSIETLVDRSSGQFVYASTVLKFVDDPDCRPTEQLRVILGLSSSTEGAFPELDKLYSEILSRCRNPKRMLTVLGHVLALTQGNQVTLLSDAMGTGGLLAVVDQLLSLKSGDAFMSLRGLHSLIYIPNPAEPKEGEAGIRFYHASFSDFLMASSRSGQYYIRMRDMHAQITRSCLRILSQRPAKAELDVYLGWAYAVLFWCHHCSRSSFDEALIEDLRCFNPSKDWVLVQTSFSAHVDEKKLRKALEIFGVAHLDGCPGQGRWMPRNPDIFLMSEELRMVLTWFQQPVMTISFEASNGSLTHNLSVFYF